MNACTVSTPQRVQRAAASDVWVETDVPMSTRASTTAGVLRTDLNIPIRPKAPSYSQLLPYAAHTYRKGPVLGALGSG